MNFKKKIFVITGSRSDYGIMSHVLKEMQQSKKIDLKLIVTCMHLIPQYGNSYKEIIKDGIKIYKKIKLPLKGDKVVDISKATALGIVKFTKLLSSAKPDLVMILGDRFESMAFAISALYLKIPIVHIHGGESTFAVIDDAIRHSITKMATYHFVSTEFYKNRLKNMGEDSKKIFNIGSLGVENINKFKFYEKKLIEKKLNTKLFQNNLIVTFHPETIGNQDLNNHIELFLNYLNKIKNTKIIITAPNADMGSSYIFKKIKKFTMLNKKNTILLKSMGQKLYFSLLRYTNVVIGNSSSGVIEVPSFKIPSINIGTRQLGRIKSKSVINCAISGKDFRKALKKALSGEFQKRIQQYKNPYSKKNSGKQLIKILEKIKSEKFLGKKFYEYSG